jgi:hypothetical protein
MDDKLYSALLSNLVVIGSGAFAVTLWTAWVLWPDITAGYRTLGERLWPSGSVDEEPEPSNKTIARQLVRELLSTGECFGSFRDAGLIRGQAFGGTGLAPGPSEFHVWCGPRFKLCADAYEAAQFIEAYLDEKRPETL